MIAPSPKRPRFGCSRVSFGKKTHLQTSPRSLLWSTKITSFMTKILHGLGDVKPLNVTMYTHQARIISDGTCGCPRTFTTNSWAGTWPPNKSSPWRWIKNPSTCFFLPKNHPKYGQHMGNMLNCYLHFSPKPPPPWSCEVKGFSLRILPKNGWIRPSFQLLGWRLLLHHLRVALADASLHPFTDPNRGNVWVKHQGNQCVIMYP